MQQKKVLIIEPHPYHNEILPGFVKYFQDLNYGVDLMVREEVYKENVFCKYKNKPNIFPYKMKEIKNILANDSIKKYDFLFCSSLEFLHKNPSDTASNVKEKFVDFLGFIPKTKLGMLGVYHTLDFINQFEDYNLYNEGRIFTLTGYAFENKKTLVLNPHFFGDVKIKSNLNKKIRFITVGMLKDRELLKDTVDKLMKNKIKNFEIIVVSRTRLKFPIRMWKYIKVLHNPNFPKMYKEIENADFCLPLLDPANPGHQHYLTDCASGAKQLVLGFLTPCLINSEFAQKYGFNNRDSILYEDKNLYDAMDNAINIKQDEYASMQSNLKILADNVYKESLNNLKNSIERIESAK